MTDPNPEVALMRTSRREFLNLSVGAAAMGLATSARGSSAPKVKAILFDAFPIFDPRPISALAKQFFPGKGAELTKIWTTRQFEYTWLRTASRRYEDFWKVTEDALVFALMTLKLQPMPETCSRLMNAYLDLKPWPDVTTALGQLKESGVRLGFLSNFTPRMLEIPLKASRLSGMFEHVISTDRAKTYKPDPRAYQLGLDAFGFSRDETVFAAFAAWDAAGAKWFGYRTFWVNRSNQLREELDAVPDATGRDLADLVEFVKS